MNDFHWRFLTKDAIQKAHDPVPKPLNGLDEDKPEFYTQYYKSKRRFIYRFIAREKINSHFRGLHPSTCKKCWKTYKEYFIIWALRKLLLDVLLLQNGVLSGRWWNMPSPCSGWRERLARRVLYIYARWHPDVLSTGSILLKR